MCKYITLLYMFVIEPHTISKNSLFLKMIKSSPKAKLKKHEPYGRCYFWKTEFTGSVSGLRVRVKWPNQWSTFFKTKLQKFRFSTLPISFEQLNSLNHNFVVFADTTWLNKLLLASSKVESISWNYQLANKNWITNISYFAPLLALTKRSHSTFEKRTTLNVTSQHAAVFPFILIEIS